MSGNITRDDTDLAPIADVSGDTHLISVVRLQAGGGFTGRAAAVRTGCDAALGRGFGGGFLLSDCGKAEHQNANDRKNFFHNGICVLGL